MFVVEGPMWDDNEEGDGRASKAYVECVVDILRVETDQEGYDLFDCVSICINTTLSSFHLTPARERSAV